MAVNKYALTEEIYGQYASDHVLHGDQISDQHDGIRDARGDGNVGLHHSETLFDEGVVPDELVNMFGPAEDIQVVTEENLNTDSEQPETDESADTSAEALPEQSVATESAADPTTEPQRAVGRVAVGVRPRRAPRGPTTATETADEWMRKNGHDWN